MKLADREQIIRLLLPLAVVLAGYASWFGMFQRPQVAAAARDLKDAQSKAVTPEDILQQQVEAKRQRQEAEQQEARKAKLQQDLAQLVRSATEPARRMQSLRDISALLERHRLRLIEEGPSSGKAGAKLPTSLTKALSRLDVSDTKDTAGELRDYKLTGGFMDLLKALQELADDEQSPGIPISLSMEPAVDGESIEHTWVLTIWM